MATGCGDSGFGRVLGPFRPGSSRGRGFAPGRELVSPVLSWVGGLSASSQAGASDGGLGVGFKKRGRNSPALSAYNGDSKRSRVGVSMP